MSFLLRRFGRGDAELAPRDGCSELRGNVGVRNFEFGAVEATLAGKFPL